MCLYCDNSHVQIPSGTMESKRTTVPFLYNLEPEVEGIDVIDFPGVDDSSQNMQVHGRLLFELPQIIIFLVDYRYVCVLICLYT